MLRLGFALALLASAAAAQTPIDITPQPGMIIDRIAPDPLNPQHLAVNAQSPTTFELTVFESFDAGASWSPLLTGAPGVFYRITCNANGEIITMQSGLPVQDPSALVRWTAGGPVSFPGPPPLTAFPGNTTRLLKLWAHPTRPGVLAVAADQSDPTSGDYARAILATTDGGTTWTQLDLLTFASMIPGGVNLLGFGATTTQDLLIALSASITPLGNPILRFNRFDLDTGTKTTDATFLDFPYVYSAARVDADVRYRAFPYGAAPGSGIGFIQRKVGAGDWEDLAPTGEFFGLACGNVNTDLVCAGENDAGTIRIHLSRDRGETWTVLQEYSSTTPVAQFTFSATDDRLFVTAEQSTLYSIVLDAELGAVECPGVANSTGQPGVLGAIGQGAASVNRLNLSLRSLPPGAFFLPISGRNAGFFPNPGGSDGNLCIGSFIGRVLDSVGQASALGEGHTQVDLTALPGPGTTATAVAGQTWRFQGWYRDGVAASNFTNVVAVTWQ